MISRPTQVHANLETCGKAVTWKQKGIRCDNSECQQWYHTDCQNMRSTIYECMNSSNCVWECFQCAMPNFSTTLFDLHSISSDNSFSKLSESCDNTDCSGCSSPGPPLASSSPTKSCHTATKCKQKPLRLLNVNCQSIVNKKEEIDHLLYSTKTDIIVGTESWLTPDIKDHEVFPPDFTIYRRDRTRAWSIYSSKSRCC